MLLIDIVAALENKTNKDEYKVYTPYEENSEENPCDLYKLNRGSAILPALVCVKNGPFKDNKVRDATVFVPSRHFGWQLLGEFQGLFYQRFDWEGNAWGNWEQIVFVSMLFHSNLIINSNFKINQKGETSYRLTNEYGVDRWKGWNIVETVTENGVTVSLDNPGYWELHQYIEIPLSYILGQTMTGSVCVDGNVYFATFYIPYTMPAETQSITYHLFEEFHIRLFLIPETNRIDLMFYDNQGATRSFKWVKLEFGSIPTTYIPPNPTEDLKKCRWFYREITGAFTTMSYSSLDLNFYIGDFDSMRIPNPTLKFKTNHAYSPCVREKNCGSFIDGFSFMAREDRFDFLKGICVTATKSVHGFTDNTYLVIDNRNPLVVNAEIY